MSKLIKSYYKLKSIFSRKNSIPDNLTPQEEKIFDYLMDSLTYKEIGNILSISPKTVSTHSSNIFKKSNCNSRKELQKKFKKEYEFKIKDTSKNK